MTTSNQEALIRQYLTLVPFALFIMVLPFPHITAVRSILLFIVIITALTRAIKKGGNKFKQIPCIYAISTWSLLCAISLAWSIDPAMTRKELANEVFLTLSAFLSFFVISKEYNSSLWLLRAIGAGLLIIGGMALIAWLRNNYAWDESSNAGGVGIFSTYIATILPALILLSIHEKQSLHRAIFGCLTIFAIFLGTITQERIFWVAIAAQTIAATPLIINVFKPRRMTLILVPIIAVIVFSAWGINHTQTESGRFNKTETLSSDSRVGFWPSVISTIRDHPIKGAGFGREAMKKAYPELIPKNNGALWHAHNVFLNYGIETGIPGIIALSWLFSCFLFFFFKNTYNQANPSLIGIAGIMLITGVVTRNMTNDFFLRDMSLLYWSLMGIFVRNVILGRFTTRI